MLARREYSEDLRTATVKFNCGGSTWAREGALWLQTPAGPGVDPDSSALAAMEAWGTKVWLYEDVDPAQGSEQVAPLIGFGAVGITSWKVPTGKEKSKAPISILPWWAISKDYQHKPDGPSDQRYASQILDDLIAEARQNWKDDKTGPWFGLAVDPNNKDAIKCYLRHEFVAMSTPYKGLTKMLLKFEE